jgi:hypothetical protein
MGGNRRNDIAGEHRDIPVPQCDLAAFENCSLKESSSQPARNHRMLNFYSDSDLGENPVPGEPAPFVRQPGEKIHVSQ